jgi:hypothetical protein
VPTIWDKLLDKLTAIHGHCWLSLGLALVLAPRLRYHLMQIQQACDDAVALIEAGHRAHAADRGQSERGCPSCGRTLAREWPPGQTQTTH